MGGIQDIRVNTALRNSILVVHRWTGLTVGLMLVFLAITGASMAFRTEVEPVIESELHDVSGCAARLPLDALAARAHAAYPEKPVVQVETSDAGRVTAALSCRVCCGSR